MKIGVDIRELERGKMTGIGRFLRNFIAYARTARPQHQFVLYGNQATATGLAGGNVEERICKEGGRSGGTKYCCRRWSMPMASMCSCHLI